MHSRYLCRAVVFGCLGVAAFARCKGAAEIEFSEETKAHQDLLQVALGKSPATLIVHNADILNVFTEQWTPGQDIVIKDQRIAWVGPQGTWRGTCDKTIDAGGLCVVPGFGESHKHLESTEVTPEYEGALCIPFGTTWTTEGSHELSNVDGAHNVAFWLEARGGRKSVQDFSGAGRGDAADGLRKRQRLLRL